MWEYLIILNLGKDYKIPLNVRADSNASALLKASQYCINEGYDPIGMESIQLLNSFGVIEVK